MLLFVFRNRKKNGKIMRKNYYFSRVRNTTMICHREYIKKILYTMILFRSLFISLFHGQKEKKKKNERNFAILPTMVILN